MRSVTSGSSPASIRRARGWRSTASISVKISVPRHESSPAVSRTDDTPSSMTLGDIGVQRRQEQRLLVLEVGVGERAADAGVAGDVGHGRGPEAVPAESVDGHGRGSTRRVCSPLPVGGGGDGGRGGGAM